MSLIRLELLVVLCPKIDSAVLQLRSDEYCVSTASQTRPYLRCCYISFENFKIELLEINTRLPEAKTYPLYQEALNLMHPKFVGIGYMTENLSRSKKRCKELGIELVQQYASKSPLYPSGYKHQSFLTNVKYEDQFVYVSQYDPTFFEKREREIAPKATKNYGIQIALPENFYYLQSPQLEKTPLRSEEGALYIPVKNKVQSPVDWLQFEHHEAQ